MDEEKFQRAIDIILQNQAQFYADLQQVQEEQKEATKRADVLEKISLNLYNTSVEHHNTMVEQGKNIGLLTAEIREMRDAHRDAQKETDERFRETDERLNAVIFMAEKFFSGQNGKSN